MSSNLISELRNMLDDIDALGAGPLTVDTHLIREAMAGLILAEQFRGHERIINALLEGNAKSDARMKRLESLCSEVREAELVSLRLVAARSRELVAWFSSGNSVPVDRFHLIKVKSHDVNTDVFLLRQALSALPNQESGGE